MKKLVFVLSVSVGLVSCGARKAPAPIADIQQAGGSYSNAYRNTLNSDKYTVNKG